MRTPDDGHEWSATANRLWIPEGVDPRTGAEVFTSLGLRALRSFDDGRWHVSVSRRNRYPSWDELADARYDLGPLDVEMAMFLPPPKDYVNLHPYVFHLWQVIDPDRPGWVGDDPALQMRRSRETEPMREATE